MDLFRLRIHECFAISSRLCGIENCGLVHGELVPVPFCGEGLIGNNLATILAVPPQCHYNEQAGHRRDVSLSKNKNFLRHSNMLPIPRSWPTRRTQNPACQHPLSAQVSHPELAESFHTTLNQFGDLIRVEFMPSDWHRRVAGATGVAREPLTLTLHVNQFR